MNNVRERERETRGTTCSSLVSLHTCVTHDCVNYRQLYFWEKKEEKKAESLIFQRKGMLCIGYSRVHFTHMSTDLYLTNTRNKES